MGRIGLRENLIKKWKISPQFRKYAEEDTYSAIKSHRNGVKKKYIVSTVKKLYYEAGRRVSKFTKLKELPTFVDVFAGTGIVAASMGAPKGFPPPIVNDYDPVMVCFAWAFSHCQSELCERIADFHQYVMRHDFKPTDFSYNIKDYERHYESIDPKSLHTLPKNWDDPKTRTTHIDFYGYSEEKIEEEKRFAQRHQEFIMRARSSYKGVKKVLALRDSDRDNLRNTVNKLPPHSNGQLEDVLDYAQAIFYYYSFAPSGKTGNIYHEIIVDVNSYIKFLRELQVKLDAVMKENKADNKAKKAKTLLEFKLEDVSLTLDYNGDFARHLRHATFCCKDFKDILQEDPSDKIFYLDSPYFLTVGYDVGFSDNDHIAMLDILRNATFRWIFSMQYKPSKTSKCTTPRDEAVRKKQPHIIKDYGAYYRGFYAPFQPAADPKVYDIPKDTSMQVSSDLYAILFDKDADKEVYEYTTEMLVVNFDCLQVIPLHDKAVALPFDLFLQCADADMAYQDIVKRAIIWRKDNIANNFASKEPV